MRRVILIVQVLVASMQMGFAEDSKTSPAWSNDWTAFIKTLSKEVGKNSNFEYNVNDAFLGKTVVWTGTVTDIKHPTADNRTHWVDLAMKPERLAWRGKEFTLDSLHLIPREDEDDTWKNVSAGDKVTFRTTLSTMAGAMHPYFCVLTIMEGAGPSAGKTLVAINIKDGSCLKSEPSGKKKQ